MNMIMNQFKCTIKDKDKRTLAAKIRKGGETRERYGSGEKNGKWATKRKS